MTVKIEVTIPEDDVRAGASAQYLANALAGIGFVPRSVEFNMHVLTDSDRAEIVARGPGDALPDEGPNYAAMKAAADESEAPKKRGRRTKAEIEAEKAAAEAPPPATRDAREADALANISTGEERIDPTTEAEQAQDAADEAAEVAAQPVKELTHDDVRAALKAYMDFYGQAATMEDGPKVFKEQFGSGVAKVSDIPNDQASLQKAINGVNEMRAKNRFNREPNL